MTAVVIALLPAAGFGIYNFGPRALAVMAVTIASTVLTELLFGWLWKKKITISDMSAVVTGLLLALNLPVSIPLWMAALGGVFAILVVKLLFGGLGQNFMNPALAARCFLLISFPSQMTNFACDAYTGATPLAALKAGESVNVMYHRRDFRDRTADRCLFPDPDRCDRPSDPRYIYCDRDPVCGNLRRARL